MIPIFALILALEFPATPPLYTDKLITTELQGGVRFNILDGVFIVGGAKTFVIPNADLWAGMSPIYVEFLMRIFVRYKLIEFGFEHMCPHNISGWYWSKEEGSGYIRFYASIRSKGWE